MKYTVLSIAYPFAPVRPDTAGGAEQVLGMLDGGIVEAGHESVVVACRGSQVRGELVETPYAQGVIDDRLRQCVYADYRAAIAQAIENYNPDVIHMHGIDFDQYLPAAGPAVLVTLHVPIAWYTHDAISGARPGTFFNCVSRSQFHSAPLCNEVLAYIENGVPCDAMTSNNPKEPFVLALGRICPEKGYHIALDAARNAQVPMVIAGQLFNYPAYQRYYVEQILPRLDGQTYQFIGPVGPQRKSQLLSKAQCVLIPSLAPETSSLVAMEAMACGTAVVAFGAGALVDIVENGKTGFIVRDGEEMAAAIKLVPMIEPQVCRETARMRFSASRMIAEYLKLYNCIIEKQTAPCAGLQGHEHAFHT